MEYVKENGDKVNVKGLTVTVALGDETMSKINEIRREIASVGEENTKLREALRAAWKCAHAGISCSDCRLIAGGCTLQSAMRELGMEVPE